MMLLILIPSYPFIVRCAEGDLCNLIFYLIRERERCADTIGEFKNSLYYLLLEKGTTHDRVKSNIMSRTESDHSDLPGDVTLGATVFGPLDRSLLP